MSKQVETIPLKKIAIYSKKRISCDLLDADNFIGTDNLQQNKAGKTKALYTPINGTTTKYDGGDILIANIRPYLKKIWYAKNPGGSSTDVLTLAVNNKDFDSKFVYYNLFKDDFFNHMMVGSKGTKMPRGDKNQILFFPIPNFELRNQQKIAHILSTLDSKIELNNRINAELEKMAKTLYDYWFVQFDFPDKNGKSYKSSGGKMVFDEKLKREMPEGWEVERMNSKITIGSGFSFKSNNYDENGKYKVVTIKNVQDGILDTLNTEKVEEIPEKINDICILDKGDILMSLTGNVGRMAFVDEENLLLNQRVGKIVTEKKFLNYIYLFFLRPENRKWLEQIAGGSSQANLSPVDTAKRYIIFPDNEILNNFNKVISPIFENFINNKAENKKLAELRDWLLPMLMNGQVEVK